MKDILIILCSVALLSGCQLDPCGYSPEQFVDRFEQFVDDVDNQELTFDDQKWDEHDKRFKKYLKECYPKFEDDLTRKDDRRFTEATAKYYLVKYGKGLKHQYEDDAEEISRVVEKNIDSFVQEYGDDIERIVEDFFAENEDNIRQLSTDIEQAVDRFVRNIDEEQIDSAMEQFRQMLEELETEVKKE